MQASASAGSANINYYGINEGSGVMLAVTWEGPLDGATPL
jgi:hypothetical protein